MRALSLSISIFTICFVVVLAFANDLNAEKFLFGSKAEFLEVYKPIAARHDVVRPMSLVADITESKNGIQMPGRQIRVFIREDCIRVDDESADGEQVSRVASPEQTFRAIRKGTDSEFQFEFSNENLNEMLQSCRATAPVVNPYYHFLETSLVQFFERTDVELESSQSSIDENGQRVVEISVSRVVLAESGELTKWFYSFSFLPDKQWVLSKYGIGNAVVVLFFHTFDTDAIPLISRVDVEEKSEGYVHEAMYQVTAINLKPARLSEFSPSAFDSSEIEDEIGNRGLLVLLTAVVLVLIALIYRRRSRTLLD